MDAVGSARAALFGHSEGALMCILFAATYPERTIALTTYGAFAKRLRSDDYPWAPTLQERLSGAEELERNWGNPRIADLAYYAPSIADDASFQEWLDAYFRRSASPKAAADLLRMNSDMHVRDVLVSVRVPTLVLHAVGDRDVQAAEGRYIASRIPGARYVEFSSGDHLFWASHQDEILAEIQELLTGVRPPPEHDRILATVLFTDIVEGTKKAAALGDHRWRDLLESHHVLVRAELSRHRGVEQDTAGDGFYATFDGPARAMRCALAIRDGVRRLGLEIRAGVHTGECEVVAGKLGGIATMIGARVKELADAGEVLATSTVRDLVSGSGLTFIERGTHALKVSPASGASSWYVNDELRFSSQRRQLHAVLNGGGSLGIRTVRILAGLAVLRHEYQEDNRSNEWHQADEQPPPAPASIVQSPHRYSQPGKKNRQRVEGHK